jgi:hypothetical protein
MAGLSRRTTATLMTTRKQTVKIMSCIPRRHGGKGTQMTSTGRIPDTSTSADCPAVSNMANRLTLLCEGGIMKPVHRLFTAVAVGRRFLLVSLALALSSCCAVTAFGQPRDFGATPRELVEKLQASLAAYSVEESESLTEALIERGEAALPAIEQGLLQSDRKLASHLLRVLGGIGGDGSTSLLVSAIPRYPSAVGRLENREVRRPLSPEESAALVAQVESGHVLSAGTASRVLAKCIRVPASMRVSAILPRFLQEVVSPTPVGSVRYSYVSPRVLSLNGFLLAFSYIGEPAVSALSQQRQQATDPELRKWVALALGMAGDASVSGELEQVVRGDPDRYVRCVAVRAYARAAGPDAIPLLRSLLADETESEYYRTPFGDPYRLIAGVARGELSRLEREAVTPYARVEGM